jgi:hypothetical protein
LSDEEKVRAFDRFWRGRTSGGGSGLGLAIARKLLETDGCTIVLRDGALRSLEAVVSLRPLQASPTGHPRRRRARTSDASRSVELRHPCRPDVCGFSATPAGSMPDAGFLSGTNHSGMSYAVLWSENGGPMLAGKLELLDRVVLLEGANGDIHRCSLDLRTIGSFRIGRSRIERLQGRPVLVLEDGKGYRVRVTTLSGVGALYELADLIGSKLNESAARD